MGVTFRYAFDACCVSRLSDDRAQLRVQREAEAIESLLELLDVGQAVWVANSFLKDELAQNPNPERRRDALALLAFSTEWTKPEEHCYSRAQDLIEAGFGLFDALHIAVAEQGAVDILFTTDDRLLKRVQRDPALYRVKVANPLSWMKER